MGSSEIKKNPSPLTSNYFFFFWFQYIKWISFGGRSISKKSAY